MRQPERPGVQAGFVVLLVAVVASVLAFGATLPGGALMLQLLVTASAVAMFWRGEQLQALPWSGIMRPVLLFAGVVLVQLVFRRSAYWNASYAEAMNFAAYGTAFAIALSAGRRESNVRAIAYTLVVFGSAYAFFAIIQQLTGTDELYWVLKPRQGGNIYGSYVNHNHFAGLMEMLTPFPLLLSFRERLSARMRALLLFCAALMATSIVLSGSRGGTAALLVQLVFVGFLLRRTGAGARRIQVAAGLAVIVLLVLWVGADRVTSRWSDPIADPIRAGVFKDAPRMWIDRPILGWGLGTFPTVYPHYRSYVTEYFVNQAHNDALQVLLETGVIGFAAALWFLFAMYRAGFSTARSGKLDFVAAARMASLVGCTGIVVHSFTDFNLHIPANALLFFVLAGLTSSQTANVLEFRRSTEL